MTDSKIPDLTTQLTTRALLDLLVLEHDPSGTPETVKMTAKDFLREVATELTISSDAVTLTQLNHKLQPQSGTSDNLSTINGTTAGQSGVLYASDYGTDTITIKHNVGNILCMGAADITLSHGCVFWYSDGTKVYISGGGGVVANAPITGATKTKITYDSKGLVTAGADAKAYQTYNGHGLNGTIAAGATQYTPVGLWGLNATNYGFVTNRAGKIKNLYQRINSTQPATGSLVVTVYVNGVASSLVLTIAANSVTGVYSETSTEVTVAAGDAIVIGIKNNASGASAFIGANSLDFEYSVV